MGRVIIGMDPHKRSATIEIIDDGEQILIAGRFATDRDGYRSMLKTGRRYPDRIWAVEGCNGIGRHLAQRLVADGETVIDVPAKLSARARVFATGQGRKTDPVDAHSVAVVALRTTGLRQVTVDDSTVALRLLVDRRDELGRARTETISRLHQQLLELIPGGAKQFLSAAQARALLATVRPRDIVGRTRRQLAAELITELTTIDKKIKAANKQLTELVAATGSSLLQLNGIGPSGAARLLGDIGDITRFASRAHFASWNAPPRSTPPPATNTTTDSPGPATAASTGCCTSWPLSSCATTPRAAPTTAADSPQARPRWKPSEPSNAAYPTSSTNAFSTTPDPWRRAREDTGERLYNPARPAQSPQLTLRNSHFPDPPPSTLEHPPSSALDIEGCQMRAKPAADVAATA